jgi:hypothetical protein
MVHKYSMSKLISPNRINDQYITAAMASTALSVSIARIHQLIHEGKLPGFKIADRVCVARRDVDRMAKDRAGK